MLYRFARAVCVFGLLFVFAGVSAARPSVTFPPGFADELVTEEVTSPTALAFTPDGRMLISSQLGELYVYQNGALRQTPALDLGSKVCTNSERGLLGVAVDPNFASNHFIYLYYTFNKHNQPSNDCGRRTSTTPVNRVSRFVLADNNVVSNETVLIDNIPSPAGNHNAGDLHFGKDGYLYVSVGDGGCDYANFDQCAGNNDAARDQFILLGKILRIESDGGIPPDNPYTGTDSARCNVTGRTDSGKKCQETFAWGLRNPFRMAFDPNAAETRFFINDVGQNVWEEIDLGQAGADYGWNVREGHCARGSTTDCGPPPAGMTNPIYDYNERDIGCDALTGGAFVPNGIWPAAYDGAYLFGDYGCGKIFALTPKSGGGFTRSEFVTGLGANSAVHMTFGPFGTTQALYYTSYANGGQVRRVFYTASANRAPVAVAQAAPTSGKVPLTVNFNGGGSSDPDGDPLTYEWDFGDGSSGAGRNVEHVYQAIGTYTATLVVRDNRGGVSQPDSVRIDVGNTPPVPQIDGFDPAMRFKVGQQITLQGSATDAEDGQVTALSWRVILHHDDHTHPYQTAQGNSITIEAPAPEDLEATQTSYVEVELTATDSHGLTAVVTRELRPNLVNVGFATEPAGLTLFVNGSAFTAPQTFVSWEGYALNVVVPTQQDATGQWLAFGSWSDGDGSATRVITTPAGESIYTAQFVKTNATFLPIVARE